MRQMQQVEALTCQPGSYSDRRSILIGQPMEASVRLLD